MNQYHFKATGVIAVGQSDEGQPTVSYKNNLASAAIITPMIHLVEFYTVSPSL